MTNPIIKAVMNLLNPPLPPQESVLPQYRGPRMIATDSPKKFDGMTWVHDGCKTASYVDADGVLVFVMELP